MREDLLYIIALTKTNGIGPILAKQLISYCGGAKEVFQTKKNALAKIPQVGQVKANLINLDDVQAIAEKELEFISKHKIRALTFLDEDYPRRLMNFDDSPILLYYKGNTDLNSQRTIAIVGTRTPTEYGKLSCEKLVEEISVFSPVIISGMAYGIDSVAHRKSVELNIPTIGILGHGLDRLYPASNRDLAAKMSKNGGLLTEFPSRTNPDRENFPMRNRIIAALSDAVIVIESKAKGGSMITAELANGYFKDVFALPGRIGDDKSKGCNMLIKSHKAALIESGRDIGYIMRWEERSRESAQTQLFIELNPLETKIIEVIRSSKEMTIDNLHYMLKIPVSEISGVLLNLEFKGIIRSLPGKRYILS